MFFYGHGAPPSPPRTGVDQCRVMQELFRTFGAELARVLPHGPYERKAWRLLEHCFMACLFAVRLKG